MRISPGTSRRGFTLIELMLASVIIAILLLGMQSAMMLAARANPDRGSANSCTATASAAVDRIAADLAYATGINTMTASAIEFTVPDRNNDGAPETISYAWSGTAGDPLTRSVNGGSATTIAKSVYEFALTYDKRSLQRSTTYTESGEVLLNSYDGAGLLNLGDSSITSNNWCGQYFKPTLPGAATSYRVTRARFRARVRGPSGGSARVQIRNVSGTTPTTVIDEATLSEASLNSSYAWQDIAFGNVSGIAPATGLCLVIQWASDAEACEISYQALAALGANATFVKTTNAGASWSAPLAQDMPYYVYGTYSTADPVATDFWLTNVRCAMRCGSDASARVQTSVRVFNEPQVAGP